MNIVTAIGFGVCAVLAVPAVLFVKRFPRDVQAGAATKAFFLWFFATTPIFAGIVMTKMQSGADVGEQVQTGILGTISFTEVFVYTASFVSPLLYMLFDFLRKLKGLKSIRELQQLLHNMRGMPWIILSSLVLLGITLLAYGSAKSDPDGFSKTLMAGLFTDKGWMVYALSLLIWYCVILWEQDPDFSFERQEKNATQTFAERYAQHKGKKQ